MRDQPSIERSRAAATEDDRMGLIELQILRAIHSIRYPTISGLVRRLLVILFLLSLHPTLVDTPSVFAWEWVPTAEEIGKYRKSWNPFSHGPILLQAVDIQPEGQLSIREFVFSQVGETSFGNKLSFATQSNRGPVHVYQVSPSVNTAYGITDHIELGVAISMNSFWARQNGKETTDTGLGDSSLIMKYRPIVQDPDGWRPTITHFSQLVLPTSQWITGTERPPGGFASLGRLPNTRFGEWGFTQGIMTRKNLEPFRINAAVFYTYSAPGNTAGRNTYSGDVINTRLIVEHILDDKRGFGYNIEISTLHGATWRADGHSINSGQLNGFSIIGVEPALQWRMGEHWVAAAGCLFTVAGQNAINAFYPNISIFWYWSKTGIVRMR